jgi:hypothetical protein
VGTERTVEQLGAIYLAVEVPAERRLRCHPLSESGEAYGCFALSNLSGRQISLDQWFVRVSRPPAQLPLIQGGSSGSDVIGSSHKVPAVLPQRPIRVHPLRRPAARGDRQSQASALVEE